jgi:prepilin-type N-terminal cleavage/methylation domain-containing protein
MKIMTRFRNAVRKMRTFFAARAAKPARPMRQGLLQRQSVSHGAMVRQPIRLRSLRVHTGRGFMADMRATAAFTLTEIVVAVVILGVMAATVGYFVTGAREAAVLNAKQANVNTINKLIADTAAAGGDPVAGFWNGTAPAVGDPLTGDVITAMRAGVSIPNTTISFGLAAGTDITPGVYSVTQAQVGTPNTAGYVPVQIGHDLDPNTGP